MIDLNKSDVGPTKRLEFTNQLKAIDEMNRKDEESISKNLKYQKEVVDRNNQVEYLFNEYSKYMPEEEAAKQAQKDNLQIGEKKIARFEKGNKNEGGQSKADEKFDVTLAGESAKQVKELDTIIAETGDVLSNLDREEELAGELTGATGVFKATFNTSDAAEMRTLSASNLKPIMKIYNPAGALPTAKLNWIRDTYAVSPWDNRYTMAGKIKTQRTLATQARERAIARRDLIHQYKGQIPPQVQKQFDEETVAILDTIEQESKKGQKSDKKAPEGKVRVKDKATGKMGSVTPYEGMEAKYERL